MPKDTQLPNSDRHQTRPGNATAHPGQILKDALAVRRKQEIINEEKKAREERRQTKKEKKVKEEMAVMEIARFENEMALDTKKEKAQFPRQDKGTYSEMCS